MYNEECRCLFLLEVIGIVLFASWDYLCSGGYHLSLRNAQEPFRYDAPADSCVNNLCTGERDQASAYVQDP